VALAFQPRLQSLGPNDNLGYAKGNSVFAGFKAESSTRFGFMAHFNEEAPSSYRSDNRYKLCATTTRLWQTGQ